MMMRTTVPTESHATLMRKTTARFMQRFKIGLNDLDAPDAENISPCVPKETGHIGKRCCPDALEQWRVHEAATLAISQLEVAHHQKQQRAGGTANAYSSAPSKTVGRASAQMHGINC
jgi:hypothetical protein